MSTIHLSPVSSSYADIDSLTLFLCKEMQGYKKTCINDALLRRRLWARIYKYTEAHGTLGLTLQATSAYRWAVITKDPSSGYRYTLFDRKGFFGHGVYPTPDQAVQAAFDMGYKVLDSNQNRLDEIASQWLSTH